MTYKRSILLLAALWIPAVLVGFIFDRHGYPVEWWGLRGGALVVYAGATTGLSVWLRERRTGSREPGVK